MVQVLENVDMFKRVAEGDKPLVILASAIWCGPCKVIKPRYERMVDDFPNVLFYTFDVEQQEDLAQFFAIKAMPTFFVLHKKKLILRREGADIVAVMHVLKEVVSGNSVQQEDGIVPNDNTFDSFAQF